MPFHNDDIDELFRRAAEGYPLNTRGANWDKVHALLSANEEPRLKDNKRRFRWLILLFPALLMGKPLMDGLNKTMTRDRDSIASAESKPGAGHPTASNDRTNTQRPGAQLKLQSLVTAESRSTNHRINLIKPTGKVQSRVAQEKARQQKVVSFDKNGLPPSRQQTISVGAEGIFRLNKAVKQFERENIGVGMPELIIVNRDKSSLVFAAKTAPDAVEKTKPPTAKRRRIYAGVVAGPDLSTVQLEKFSQPGFQAGILIGYQLTNRLSIEAAALSSKKYYYSEGEYIRSSRVYRPAYAELLSANGNCRMLELPVSLHYAFSKKAKHAWFAAAGISSYLMKKEDYTYNYKYLNNGSVVSYNKIYENETRNWLSVLQLSAGYTLKLGGGNLRVEPYYALPISGIGYGEMSLHSMGLRLGITTKRF